MWVNKMIGKVLKYMRTKNNLSQEELSNLIYIKQNTLSRYETETNDINFETIEKIANKCGYKIYFENSNFKDKFESKDILRKDI